MPVLRLIAVGGVFKFAITEPVSGLSLGAVGVIMMVVGAIGMAITLILMSTRRRTDVVYGPQRSRLRRTAGQRGLLLLPLREHLLRRSAYPDKPPSRRVNHCGSWRSAGAE